MPGRLAGHRHAGEALPGRPGSRPAQRGAQIPGPAPEGPTRQHLRVVIADHDHLLGVGQVNPDDRVPTGTSPRSRASLALRLRSPRDTPLPLPTNVLLLRWDTKPAAHQEDVPTPDHDTQNVFLCRGPAPPPTGATTFATTSSEHGKPGRSRITMSFRPSVASTVPRPAGDRTPCEVRFHLTAR